MLGCLRPRARVVFLVFASVALPSLGWPALGWAADHHTGKHEAAEHHFADSEPGEHAAEPHDGKHGHGAGHHAAPTFADINWYYGLLGEKEGAEPSLLFRPPGTPVPLGALLLNTAILFYFLGRFGGPAIRSGLSSRKQRIAGDIQAAARMKEEAKGQLDHYEQKLAHISAELERILAETRAQSALEHERIVQEAKVRHSTLEAEARSILVQELAHGRQAAVTALIDQAVAKARERISSELESGDHDRLAQNLVESVETQLKAGGHAA